MQKKETYLEQARRACAQNEYALASTLYEGLLRESPGDPEVLREYGNAIYSEFGDVEKAVHLFERSLERDPSSSDALLHLAVLYAMGYGKGYAAALPVYQQILRLNSSNKELTLDAYLGIGMLHHVPDSPVTYEEVITAFRNAVKADPQRADAHHNLGVALLEGGEREQAQKELLLAEQLLSAKGLPTKGVQSMLKIIENNESFKRGPYINLSTLLSWP